MTETLIPLDHIIDRRDKSLGPIYFDNTASKAKTEEEKTAFLEMAETWNLAVLQIVKNSFRQVRCPRKVVIMISSIHCKNYSELCERLAQEPDISIQRSTVLLAMATSWTAIVSHTFAMRQSLRVNADWFLDVP